MRLFKSLLLTLLVIGTLNSCEKDDGGDSDDNSDNSDTTQPNYTVAAVNMLRYSYSYTLTKESNNLELFTAKRKNWDLDIVGEIAYDSKGSPSGYYIDGLDCPIKTKDKLITEIINPFVPANISTSNFKLISKSDNTYKYGQERVYGDGDGSGVAGGCLIRLFPEFDSIHVYHFNEINGDVEYNDSFGISYRKECKTSFSLNFLNLNGGKYGLSPDNWEFYDYLCISSILDNMGATYFTSWDNNNRAQHKDYKISFNDKKLPVRVDGILNRRIWTATYQ